MSLKTFLAKAPASRVSIIDNDSSAICRNFNKMMHHRKYKYMSKQKTHLKTVQKIVINFLTQNMG